MAREVGASVDAHFWETARSVLLKYCVCQRLNLLAIRRRMIVTIIPDAWTAAQFAPELVRDCLDYAMSSAGHAPLVDVFGMNEQTDVASAKTAEGFRVAVVNHNEGELEVTLKPLRSAVGQASQWVDLYSRGRTVSSTADRVLKVKVPAGGFRALEFRR
jgi:hypothetical protein